VVEIARVRGVEFGWGSVQELRAELSAREESFGALVDGLDSSGTNLDSVVKADAEVGRD
jgi:hypothetical protein